MRREKKGRKRKEGRALLNRKKGKIGGKNKTQVEVEKVHFDDKVVSFSLGPA